ncbi:MAG: hypothetical protein KBF28_07740 [Gemmatimonadales bacterium]|jgi:hypothetical protein|nr:hypothetical protein [Gemmatimonadota bacterium]MBP9898246.1 hypothetical protein [Gemmatimonadales bacterium]
MSSAFRFVLVTLGVAAIFWMTNRFLWQDERSIIELLVKALAWCAMMAALARWQSRRARAGKVSDFHPAVYFVLGLVMIAAGIECWYEASPTRSPEDALTSVAAAAFGLFFLGCGVSAARNRKLSGVTQ